jgi:hypothetical protein
MFESIYFQVSDAQIAKYAHAFPGVPVEVELHKMDAWLDANPGRRKRRYSRFIVNWLAKRHQELLCAEVAATVRGQAAKAEAQVGRYKP